MSISDPSRRTFFRLVSAASVAGAVPSWETTCGDVQKDPRELYNEVPWLNQVQQCVSEADSQVLPSLITGAQGQSIETPSAWKRKQTTIQQRWLDFLGPLDPNPAPPALKILKEDYPTGVVRQLVEYEGEPGVRVRGYLIIPQCVDEPRPGVLVLHSTVDHTIKQPAGVQGAPEKAFGLRLAQLGCVTFSPECFLWHGRETRTYEEQTSRFQKRHLGSKGMAKMLFDASRGVDVLQQLEEVDSERIGVVGHSLGAKQALYVAAFDERIQAAVSSEGGIGVGFSNWDAPWYLGEEIKDFDHDHHELLGLIAPRPFLLIGGDSADGQHSWPYIEAALQVYELFEENPPIGLFNHEQGHSVPPIAELRAYQWLTTYL